jgi:sugar phosphate isomerase/epimerase
MTVRGWNVREAVEGCARAGFSYVGLWRDRVAETGAEESARIVRDAGLDVSSLCRGGMFPAPTKAERMERLDENRRALEEAAILGTEVLVLVCGGMPDRDVDAARSQVEEGIEWLVPYAEEAGVRLGIEPLHPAFCSDRSVVATLGQANGIAERIGSEHVGVVVDVYHLWWDPDVYAEIRRASGRILGFHVNDWLRGGGDPLTRRGMMGDGVVELRRLREATDAAGYNGPIEVEIFNEEIWSMPPEEVLDLTRRRFLEHV